MSTRVLTIGFSDGRKYGVPAQQVAEHRAAYYAGRDGYNKNSQEWLEQVNYSLNDADELTDWAANNMDWIDLAPYARLIAPPKPIDFHKDWSNGNVELDVDDVDSVFEEE